MRAALLLLSIVALELIVLANTGIDAIYLALRSIASLTHVPYNTLIVLLGTGTLGLASGVVGAFAVLRRRSLVGDAVAHSALPGLAIAFMLTGQRDFVLMLVGALIAGLIGGFLISWLQRNTRIKADAALGIVLSVLFGLGIVLSRIIQDDPTGRQAGLDSFLLGKTAGMISQDLLLIAIVALNAIAIVLLLYKEFKVISFDPHFASVQGLPFLFLDNLLMGLLVVITVIGLPAVGVVLIAALLIIPGVSARFWTDRLHRMVMLAGLFGLLTGTAGTYLSAVYSDLPAGAVIVLTGTVIFVLSVFMAPQRGIFSRLIRRVETDLRVANQNLLRTLYEIAEQSGNASAAVALEAILKRRALSHYTAKALLLLAVWKGQLERTETNGFRFTKSGVRQATEVTRAHRLWEIYLVQSASIATDHVDRDADQIEHVLTPEVVRELTSRLEAEGRLPSLQVPESVHSISGEA